MRAAIWYMIAIAYWIVLLTLLVVEFFVSTTSYIPVAIAASVVAVEIERRSNRDERTGWGVDSILP